MHLAVVIGLNLISFPSLLAPNATALQSASTYSLISTVTLVSIFKRNRSDTFIRSSRWGELPTLPSRDDDKAISVKRCERGLGCNFYSEEHEMPVD